MIKTIVVLIETLLYFSCAVATLYYIRGLKPKRNHLLLFIFPFIFIASFISISMINTPYIQSVLLWIIEVLCVLSSAVYFNRSKLSSIITIYISLYSIDITLTAYIIFVLNLAKNNDSKLTLGLIVNVIISFSYILFCKINSRRIQSAIDLISKPVKRLTIASLIISAILLTLISETPNLNNMTDVDISIKIAVSLFVVFFGTVFPILIFNSLSKNFYLKEFETAKEQVQIQANHYAALAESNLEIRKFKHDYKNMKLGVTELIKEGRVNEAVEALQDYKKSTITICPFDTGNGITDALLTDKQAKIKDVNAEIIFEGSIPNDGIDPIDLCTLFGNALDNAIEACLKISSDIKKTIFISCQSRAGYVFINISNPIYENIAINDNHISTTKIDKNSHGFGLLSIEQTVKKYNGDLSISCDGNKFVMNIDLLLSA